MRTTSTTRIDPLTPEESLTVDVYALYRAGRVLLPEIAATYAALATDVHNTTGYLSRLFERDNRDNTFRDYQSGVWRPPGTTAEPAHRKLMALHQRLQEIFAESAIIVGDVGTALLMIAKAYVDAETVNEEDLQALKAQDETAGIQDSYEQPPPDPPDPPEAGDPHPYVPPQEPVPPPPQQPANPGHS